MDLYPHNRKAYERLLPVLEEYGRACIVHPTGTGKSFIGYEYVEQHPDEQILWLGPSDYIFAEQEAAFARLGAGLPANLLRMTYQKLLADLKQGAPMPSSIGCVILDEFHRCGAPRWSEGVGAVLAANPGCKVIGLSAALIRYCDGGRDMAKDLFDGHIVSEMTLPEAWTAGLLPKPVYVTSIFSMDGEFDRQLARIDDILDEDKKEEVLKTYWEMRVPSRRPAGSHASSSGTSKSPMPASSYSAPIARRSTSSIRWRASGLPSLTATSTRTASIAPTPTARPRWRASRLTSQMRSKFCTASISSTRACTSRASTPW